MQKVKKILIYYIYINPKSNWKKIVGGQLKDLNKFGILKKADVYFHISDDSHNEEVTTFVSQLVPKAIISYSEKNTYEYDAMVLVSKLAKQHPEAIIMYLHTKGMSHNIKKRALVEKILTRETFKQWKKIIKLLKLNPNINKAGYLIASSGHFVWFNFWYAKASYINQLEEPKLTNDRYYYESWFKEIKNKNHQFKDSFSIFENKISDGITSKEVTNILNRNRLFIWDYWKKEIKIQIKKIYQLIGYQ